MFSYPHELAFFFETPIFMLPGPLCNAMQCTSPLSTLPLFKELLNLQTTFRTRPHTFCRAEILNPCGELSDVFHIIGFPKNPIWESVRATDTPLLHSCTLPSGPPAGVLVWLFSEIDTSPSLPFLPSQNPLCALQQGGPMFFSFCFFDRIDSIRSASGHFCFAFAFAFPFRS